MKQAILCRQLQLTDRLVAIVKGFSISFLAKAQMSHLPLTR
jgi:hypothetical protein